MQEQRAALERGLSRVWLLWGAMLGSLVVYLLVVQVVAPADAPALPGRMSGVRVDVLLFGVAALAFLFAGALRRALLVVRTAPTAGGDGAGRVVGTALSRYFVAVIASNALVESVGILALVLYFVGLPADTVFSLLLLTALGMLLLRPRRSELDALAGALRRG